MELERGLCTVATVGIPSWKYKFKPFALIISTSFYLLLLSNEKNKQNSVDPFLGSEKGRVSTL